jgi:hypothetical protein
MVLRNLSSAADAVVLRRRRTSAADAVVLTRKKDFYEDDYSDLDKSEKSSSFNGAVNYL